MPAARSRAKEHVRHHKDGTRWAKGRLVDGVSGCLALALPKDEKSMRRSRVFCLSVFLLGAIGARHLPAQQADSPLRDAALTALKKAASFYRHKVASHGGYVYYYSVDLKERWGEGKASPDTIFVEPPGTPAVGMAYLHAYSATGDEFYLDAARETAEALVHGQLESGGWAQAIHFVQPERGRLGKYRIGRPAGAWNVSSLDDGQTQSALRLLIRADQALSFEDARIHAAALDGLDCLLKAQFPNGAFPQGWLGPAEPKPALRARFPDYDWKTEGKVKDYWNQYTLNDNLAGDVAAALIEAHQVYKDDKHKAALEKLGDFLILAQMPEPQPGWCQQYSFEMFPIWARKFEPPAITGLESQDAMETLIEIARYTGKKKYLEPIPRALAYFKTCLLPDGKIARYYELRTNKPLYMDARYQLTYDDSDLPSHYGWKQRARFEEIEKAHQAVVEGREPARAGPTEKSAEDVRRVIRELDEEGRWISTYAGERLVGQPSFERGFRYISSGVFRRNVETLSEFISKRRER
jgi:PelA/Pel-15E family pectate lyase